MSVMKMYVEEYLNAEQVAENFYIIHLSNGKEIEVTERPVHNGNVWDWKVDSQVFDTDNYALNYLKKLVAEKLGVEVQFIVIDWDMKVNELDSKNIDAVWNGMTLTDGVKAAMECSNAYCENAQVVITK